MRLLLPFMISSFAFISYGQSEFEYDLKSEFKIDLDGDLIDDKIKLYTINEWNDPGDLQKITFEFSSLNNEEIDGIDPAYQSFDDYPFLIQTDFDNLVESNLVYVINANNSTYVFLFGYSYASSPGILTIFKINKAGFDEVFDDEFDLWSIKINEDKVLVTGRANYPEVFGKNFDGYEKRTYSPYLVYQLNDSIKLLDLETEVFNIKNYAGYFGTKYRTDRTILHKNGEKPIPAFSTYRKYPETSLKRLSREELSNYSKDELRLMRNEIFADYGRKFKSLDLQEYFNSQSWYNPKYDDVADKLTEIEKANVNLILQVENSK